MSCCGWWQEPSVELALKILDGTPLRPGGRPIMSVTRAKFEQKGAYWPFVLSGEASSFELKPSLTIFPANGTTWCVLFHKDQCSTSHCFQKHSRNSWCWLVYNCLSLVLSRVLYGSLQPLLEAGEIRGEYCSSSEPFMMKLMVWYFVSDTHKVIAALVLLMFIWFCQNLCDSCLENVLWNFLCNLICMYVCLSVCVNRDR